VKPVRSLLQLLAGIAAGLLVDYLGGQVILSTAIAAAIASYGAGSLASSLLRGSFAGLVWLALAYITISLATPGSLEMISLTAKIAGMPTTLAYTITALIALVTASSISLLAHYAPKPGEEKTIR